MKYCSHCGTQLDDNANFCPNCGASIDGTTQYKNAYEEMSAKTPNLDEAFTPKAGRSRIVGGILGICLGGFGIHKFYCGKIGAGIVYLLFAWTGIPEIIGLVEGIIYLTCPTDEDFVERYCIINN